VTSVISVLSSCCTCDTSLSLSELLQDKRDTKKILRSSGLGRMLSLLVILSLTPYINVAKFAEIPKKYSVIEK